MKKKLLACVLALATTCGCVFTACSGSNGSGNDGGNSVQSTPINETYDLKLTKSIYYLEDEETQTLELEFLINGVAGSTSRLKFESSNSGLVSVNADGAITGVGGGKATVTVSIGDKSVKATVFVTMREKKITLSERTALLFIGETKAITATVYNGKNEDLHANLTWTTDDSTVATVENGVITAVGIGKTNITVVYGQETAKVVVTVAKGATVENVNSFDEEYINIYGRNYVESGALCLDYVASAVEVGFIGSSFTLNLASKPSDLYLRVYIDEDKVGERIAVSSSVTRYTIAKDLTNGQHKVRIVNTSERGLKIASFEADKFWAVAEKSDLKIEFIGDSITAGYGVWGYPSEGWSLTNSDGSNTYAYTAVQALNADYSIIASSGICVTNTNAHFPVNMETMYANAVAKDDFTPDIVVLNLGTNDAMRDPNFAENYQKFLTMLRSRYPNAYIICLYGMMGASNNIVSGIEQSLANLSDSKIVYNPFVFSQNGDGADAHPSAVAQKAYGRMLADYMESLEIK